MAESKINLPPALLGKAIDAIGVDGITRLHENYVTIVDPDRLAALERLYQEMIGGTLDGADEAVDAIAELEAETK